MVVSIKQAKDRFSELFKLAEQGETIIIANNHSGARLRLVPEPARPARSDLGFGSWREKLATLSRDWNSPEAEVEFVKQFEALDGA